MTDIHAPRFSVVICVLTGLIATALGVLGYFFPESHPLFISGGVKQMYSWSTRELGMGLTALAAAAFLRDARVIAIALLGSLVREVLDFIDFFRVEGTAIRLYFVVGISTILHTTAFVWCLILVNNQMKK